MKFFEYDLSNFDELDLNDPIDIIYESNKNKNVMTESEYNSTIKNVKEVFEESYNLLKMLENTQVVKDEDFTESYDLLDEEIEEDEN